MCKIYIYYSMYSNLYLYDRKYQIDCIIQTFISNEETSQSPAQ